VLQTEEQYKVCAATCLLIAAKAFERDEEIPKSASLHRLIVGESEVIHVEHGCSSPLITLWERYVLNSLNWDFESFPTFYSILEVFRAQGVLFEHDLLPCPLQADRHLETFSQQVLSDAAFVSVNPYLVACAVVAAARHCCHARQLWPLELQHMTGLQGNHFQHVTQAILDTYTVPQQKQRVESRGPAEKENVEGSNRKQRKGVY
jgi:Cyclin, C-terminal domain/Cyclin, N-terminal domain